MDQASIHGAEFRRCLLELDARGIMLLWKHVSPHLEQPKDENEAWIILHRARTQAESIPLRLRAYSHRWLMDNGHQSGLPDHLKPKAEQLCPRIVSAVGIAVKASSEFMRPLVPIVQSAMSDAVLDAYANGISDADVIKKSIMRARVRTLNKLLGRV